MQQYLDLIQHTLDEGLLTEGRNGDVVGGFGYQMRFNLLHGFPLLTTKALHTKSIIRELLWFIAGGTNTGYLKQHGVSIWDEWADDNGDLGPIYGKQWRSWEVGDIGGFEYIDQLQNAIEMLRSDPDSRRNIVTAWNPGQLQDMALPPCHLLFQFHSQYMPTPVRDRLARDLGVPSIYIPKRALSLQLYQRSADIGLGVPYNIASYALLLKMVAHITGHIAKDFVHTLGDYHIYANHIEPLREQMKRKPRPLPTVAFGSRPINEIDDFEFEDIHVMRYNPHPHIKMEVSA